MDTLPPPPSGYPHPTNPPEPVVGATEVLLPAPTYTVLLVINYYGLKIANKSYIFPTKVFMDDFEGCKDM